MTNQFDMTIKQDSVLYKDYCFVQNTWREFTRLTPEEEKNFREIMKHYNLLRFFDENEDKT